MHRATTAVRALLLLVIGFILLGGNPLGGKTGAQGPHLWLGAQAISAVDAGPGPAGSVPGSVTVAGPLAQKRPNTAATPATTCGQWLGLPFLNRFSYDDGQGGCSAYTIAPNSFDSLDITTKDTYMETDVTVKNGGNVTLEPGITLHVFAGSIIVQGVLNAGGTVGQPVVLTSAKNPQAPCDWGGIAFRPGSSGSLTYTQVAYAGHGLAASQ
ncbi:MAG: hypothetical protein ACR2PL_11085 [Dehalococcoidia bacterium]